MTEMTDYRTWPVAHADDPAHRAPGGYFGCPLCLNARLDAMTLCNSCDAAPALPTSAAGYCAECMEGLSETEKRYLWGDQ